MNAHHENLITELATIGIKAEEYCTVKNGVLCTGYRLLKSENPELTPIVYYSQDDTLGSFLEKCRSVAEANTPEIDAEKLKNPEYILENVRLCVQKKSQEDLLKKPLLNLEQYLRVTVATKSGESLGSIKITSDYLKDTGLTENEVWKIAEENTSSMIICQTMNQALGIPDGLFPETPLYVVSTADKLWGASALAFYETFERFCIEHDEEFVYLLPSSTEELLLYPGSCGGVSPEGLVRMVVEVNSSEVDPVLQLDPVIYRYNNNSHCVEIVASAL